MSEPSFDELIASMTADAWRNMRAAIETGRWPDGRDLLPGQRELCLQAVIAWEQRNNIPATERTGYVKPAGCKSTDEGSVVTLRQSGDNQSDDGENNA